MSELAGLRDGIPTLDFGPNGSAARVPTEEFARAGREALAQHGCLCLLDAFPREFVEELRRQHDERYARYISQMYYADARAQGHRRTLITLEIQRGFGSPEFYANAKVYAILRISLGEGFVLGHLASILSRPGSEDQFVHRDTPSLFGDDSYDARMPMVGVAMVLPFMDLDVVKGGTRIWPGSNNVADEAVARAMPARDVYLTQGSCLLFDVRTVHGGIGNRSESLRSIVYAAYHRNWFRDWDGFERQAPISISTPEFRRVPEELKHLFAWRFDRYVTQRPRWALRRAVNALPEPLLQTARRFLWRGSE